MAADFQADPYLGQSGGGGVSGFPDEASFATPTMGPGAANQLPPQMNRQQQVPLATL